MINVTNARYPQGMEKSELTIEVKNVRPVELLDLTNSLTALANEYQRHLNRDHPEDSASEVRLYVKEIKSGSIIAELIAASPQILQGVSYINSVVSFSKFLKNSYEFLTGKTDEKPVELDAAALKHLNDIVEPTAKDNGSQLNIGTLNGNVIFLTSQDANQAQNAIARLQREEITTATRLHNQVLLYWYQVKNAKNSATGDRGVIESIADYPVKVVCAHDSLKIEMILDRKNPFKSAYLVDVGVETVNGKPVVYKIIQVHSSIPLPRPKKPAKARAAKKIA